MKSKRLNLLLGLLLLTSLLFFGWSDYRDTPAGTMLISTNTTMVYSNIANWVYTNHATNSFTNMVQAIYGFTNAGFTYVGSTTSNFPGQNAYYKYVFTNEGNTNYDFSFTFATNWISNYDALLPVVGDWTIDFTTLADSNSTMMAFNDSWSTNMSEDAGIGFHLRIIPPVDAVNGTGIDFAVTNSITDPLNNGIYGSTNAYTYGGTNLFNDEISFRITAPDVKLWKAISVTNPGYPGNNKPDDAVVPGSIITYTINYTNKGDADALGIYFSEFVPNDGVNNYVGFFVDSFSGTGTAPSDTNYTDNYGTTFSISTPTASEGVTDPNIDGFKLEFGSGGLTAHSGGTVSYKVVVK